MAQKLHQSIIVENKAGAGGRIAMTYVARAAPDGYTVLVSDASLTTTPSLYKKLPIDPLKDLKPVYLFVTVPNVLVVTPALKVHTLADLIALTKKEPGKLNFGSGGVGSPLHLAGEVLRLATGMTWTHIPFKGAGPAILATVSGEVQIATPSLPSALPQVKAGKLRALAVTSPKRLSVLPDIPTMAELGYPKAKVFGWVGLSVPAGTPKNIVGKLGAAAAQALSEPGLRKTLKGLGATVVSESADDYGKLESEQAMQWKKVVRAAGIKPR